MKENLYLKINVNWDRNAKEESISGEKVEQLLDYVFFPLETMYLCLNHFEEQLEEFEKTGEVCDTWNKILEGHLPKRGKIHNFSVEKDLYREYDVPLNEKVAVKVVASSWDQAVALLKEHLKGVSVKVF